ncbi:ABC transporter permease [Limisphaera sp. 4302-co]|uniref:ABC transporter permease n=1 Tax=Limisphaera sp. 4302-co TaxID=3400417 RepID=UPI003C156379
MWTICRKELADHFNSTRFLLLFCLVFMVALISTYMAVENIHKVLEGHTRPSHVFLLMFTTPGRFFSLVEFVAFFGPLLGIIMGFDAINRERHLRTLGKLLSQPIYRDAVINGKFLAGVITVTIVLLSLLLLLCGMGLIALGVVPGGEEIARLGVYLIISMAYLAFWLGLAILFSILFRSLATSALASVALWIFFSFFMGFVANLAADAIRPVYNRQDIVQVMANERLAHALSLISPATLYAEATTAILDPFQRSTSRLLVVTPLEGLSLERFQGPLPLDQSMFLVWPHVVLLIALTLVCFGISYVTFMRQEIRTV